MSTAEKNLSAYDATSLPDGSGMKFGIVTAEWNSEITSKLESGAKETLLKANVKESNIQILSVPGSFELVAGAQFLMNEFSPDAVICIGCVIMGETLHAEYISSAVAKGLIDLTVKHNKAFIFGLLTPNNMQQAIDRSGGIHGNKGVEAAVTALKMASLRHQK